LPSPAEEHLDTPARWILSQLSRTITQVDQALNDYRFDLASKALYEFVWNQFCDWYLELAKPSLFAEGEAANAAQAAATRHTLATVLETTLRLLHPFTPFITEEIWQQVKHAAGAEGDSISLAPWPKAGAIDTIAEADMAWLQAVIGGIRSARTELNLAPGKALALWVEQSTEEDRARLNQYGELIQRLARLGAIETLDPTTHDTRGAAVVLAGTLRLRIPLAGLVDVAEELTRLNKQLAREQKGLDATHNKLNNPRFVDNAPDAVVAKERERLAAHQAAVEQLQTQIEQMNTLQGASS
jgi:valyl-tRNA synthetase